MEQIFTLDNLVTLILLTLLQAVLGFDNLLYIVLESKRAPENKRQMVRRLGIGLAVIFRIILLFVLVEAISTFQDVLFAIQLTNFVEGTFNLHSLIVLVGGVFIIYTATKEIFHMMGVNDLEHETRSPMSVTTIVFWMVAVNLVFSFDSMLSAIALSDVFWIMATAILIGGVLMIWLADGVATFLERNRMYEVMGLFILFVVGIMLLSEGAHLADLHLFGQKITPMSKATFYFVIGVLVISDIVQNRYHKRLQKMNEV
ncbi:MAG TPA: tellurium resistance protein TerC [Acidiferrobacteraceae bacterium]|nr:tellurium resistance protein TerC [Acidiferrobacteraceae bacterium]